MQKRENFQKYLIWTLNRIGDSRAIRGTERTKKLHELAWQDIVEERNLNPEEWEVYYEYLLEKDGHEQTFDLDVFAVNKNNNHKMVILAKSVQSDYNKNSNNYKNTILGEASRVLDSELLSNDTEVIFWNIVPENSPSFKKDKSLRSWSSTEKTLTTNEKISKFRKRFDNKFTVKNIMYDIKDRSFLKTKKDFRDISIEQVEITRIL